MYNINTQNNSDISPVRRTVNTPHYVILGSSFGFPYGMAASMRVRLLAYCLKETGAEVRILHTKISEIPDQIENQSYIGQYHGIKFEYTTGTTVRNRKFFMRRLIAFKGAIKGLKMISMLANKGEINALILYSPNCSMYSVGYIFSFWAHIYRIPVIGILNEWPLLKRRCIPWIRRKTLHHLLTSLDGIIPISRYLKEWCTNIYNHGKRIPLLRIPILVDLEEFTPTKYAPTSDYVLFAGSLAYKEIIMDIIQSMKVVWVYYSSIKLVITGFHPTNASAKWLRDLIISEKLNIELAGYLPRNELLDRYARARALLIPLRQNIKSVARFPTKLGEYLASGIPVVTSMIGEIQEYLYDGVNAFLCSNDNPEEFGKTILRVLEDTEFAEIVGRKGRFTAEKYFNYHEYSRTFYKFLSKIEMASK